MPGALRLNAIIGRRGVEELRTGIEALDLQLTPSVQRLDREEDGWQA